jgi:hypothetical protein
VVETLAFAGAFLSALGRVRSRLGVVAEDAATRVVPLPLPALALGAVFFAALPLALPRLAGIVFTGISSQPWLKLPAGHLHPHYIQARRIVAIL